MVNQQSVPVDGIPHQICNLYPALETSHSTTDESNKSSGYYLLIDCASGPLENVTVSLLDDSEVETLMHVLL